MSEWKPVKDYEGIYEVSNDGQVRSLDRTDCAGRSLKGKILTGMNHSLGYHTVKLARDGSYKVAYVHRLVAQAFLGDSDLQVDHINGDKRDNRVENLEWVTHSENAFRYWGMKKAA